MTTAVSAAAWHAGPSFAADRLIGGHGEPPYAAAPAQSEAWGGNRQGLAGLRLMRLPRRPSLRSGRLAMTKAMRTFINVAGPMGRLARTLVVRSIREQFAHALIVTAERPEA